MTKKKWGNCISSVSLSAADFKCAFTPKISCKQAGHAVHSSSSALLCPLPESFCLFSFNVHSIKFAIAANRLLRFFICVCRSSILQHPFNALFFCDGWWYSALGPGAKATRMPMGWPLMHSTNLFTKKQIAHSRNDDDGTRNEKKNGQRMAYMYYLRKLEE